ncbi:MAG: DUF3140 domain-containing protein [Congregibacter sp.]
MSSDKTREEIWDQWKERVNIAPAELEEWLETDESESVGDSSEGESTGHKSGRKIVEIQRTNKEDLTDDQWEHMAKVVGYINRHCAQGGPGENVESSAWRYSLMNWGHDPLLEFGSTGPNV